MRCLYENTKARLIYRIFLSLIAIGSFVYTFLGFKPIMLYFTNWSAWYAIIMVFLTLAGTIKSYISKDDSLLDNGIFKMFKFGAEIMIFATFVVSAFVLPDKIWTSGFWAPGSTFKHFLLPVFYILDGILCDKRNSYKIYYALTSLVIPIMYWVILVLRFLDHRKACGGAIPEDQWRRYYPYGFCNIDDGHTLTFLICLLAGIAAALTVTGVVLYVLNRKKSKK